MTFTYPFIGVVALVAPVAYFVVRELQQRSGRDAAYAYSSLPYLSAALASPGLPVALRNFMKAAGIGTLIAAGGGPHASMLLPVTTGTVVFCVDTSGSMKTADVRGTRAAAALEIVSRFAQAVPAQISLGLVSFSGSAQIIAMPSTDRQQFKRRVASIPRPNGQTAIGDALQLARQIMPKGGRRTIVLITDGVNNRGSAPSEAVEQLRRFGIVLDAIGDGRSGFDEHALRSFAQIASGRYAAIADANGFAATLQGIELTATHGLHRVDFSPVAATAGCAFLALAWLLGITAGRFPFLGEPEAREQLGYPDDASSLRRAGRHGDRRRSHSGSARLD